MATFRRAGRLEWVVRLRQRVGIGSEDPPPYLKGLVLKFAPPDDRAVLSPIGNHARHSHVLLDLLGIHERIPYTRLRCVDGHRRVSKERLRHPNGGYREHQLVAAGTMPLSKRPGWTSGCGPSESIRPVRRRRPPAAAATFA